MGSFLRIATLAILLSVLGTVPGHAFRLVPIEMDFEPSGRGATQIFRVENENRDPVAIEISVMARAMDMDGQDVLTPADDDWAVFPQQIILQPGETQSIRVQWLGEAAPPAERAFRLIADQLDIDIGQGPSQGGQVKLLVRYVASLYVVPPGAKADVSVLTARQVDAEGGKALELTVRNAGTSRRMLREPTLSLRSGGTNLQLTAESLEGFAGENVLAGVTRRFLLPWPAGLPAGDVSANLSLP